MPIETQTPGFAPPPVAVPYHSVQTPAVAVPLHSDGPSAGSSSRMVTTQKPVAPLESLREWATRYAWWSAFWSLTASLGVGYTVPLADDPAQAIVWLPVFALVGYLVGLVFAFPVALVAAHVFVSFSSLATRPQLLRIVFIVAATAFGSAAIIYVFSDPVFNLLYWAPALVVANLVAAIGVGRGIGPPPPPRSAWT